MNVRKAAVLMFALAAAGCASAPAPRVQVPDVLKPGANEKLARVVAAKGVQIYECRARKDIAAGQPVAYEWAFVAPEARLFDGKGKQVGRHYAGPHWEAPDGSKVVGTVKQRADASAAGAIPWLLLGTKSDGPAGEFSNVTSVQRVATVGGVAPSAACAEAGLKARVPYTADYYFFSAK